MIDSLLEREKNTNIYIYSQNLDVKIPHLSGLLNSYIYAPHKIRAVTQLCIGTQASGIASASKNS